MKISVKVHLLPTKKQTKLVALDKGATVEDAIKALGLFPDAWIAVRDSTPIPLDERLEDKEDIKLISAVSGG